MYSILQGHVLDRLRELPAESVQCVVTSPPYWGLRDYKAPGQLGLEKTLHDYIATMVQVFAELRRVLRKDGTLWLNMGDSYDSGTKVNRSTGPIRRDTGRDLGKGAFSDVGYWNNPNIAQRVSTRATSAKQRSNSSSNIDGPNRSASIESIRLKPKDLCMIPHRLAIALQDDGWWIRQDIVWSKRNPKPESVTDRPTRAHEYVFLCTKSQRYYYNADAIKEPASPNTHARLAQPTLMTQEGGYKQEQYLEGFPGKKSRDRKPADILKAMHAKSIGEVYKTGVGWNKGDIADVGEGRQERWKTPGINPKATQNDPGSKQNESFTEAISGGIVLNRNARSVWDIATAPFAEAHFATFPPKLVEPCILAGTRPGDIVLDPFSGSGTTIMVAIQHGRTGLGIELNPDYIAMAHRRIQSALGVLAIDSPLGVHSVHIVHSVHHNPGDRTMTIIIPDPILGKTVTLTLVEGENQRQVQATVGLLPSAKIITFPDPKPAVNGKATKPEPMYKKKFTGRRCYLPDGIRQRFENMSEGERLDFANRVGIPKAYINQMVREPSRGITSGMLTTILSAFDDSVPTPPVQQPLAPLHDPKTWS